MDSLGKIYRKSESEIIFFFLGRAEAAEVAEILAQYGLEPNEYRPVVNALRKRPQAWLEFMMK